jgi:peptide deformylase
MSLREIVLYPDPVLRRPAREVERFDAELERLVEDLAETMYAAPGVGLAAPQVGVDLRVAVVDVGAAGGRRELLVLVNPRLVESEGRQSEEEGCLSIPGLSERVDRPARVVVEARDARGEKLRLAAEGFLARVVCHELDHLEGVLFFERLTGLRKELAMRRLRKLPFLQQATA